MPFASKYFSNPDQVKLNWWTRCLSLASNESPARYGRKLSAAETAVDFSPSWNAAGKQTLYGKSQCDQAIHNYKGRSVGQVSPLRRNKSVPPIRTPFKRPDVLGPIKISNRLPKLKIRPRQLPNLPNLPPLSPKTPPLLPPLPLLPPPPQLSPYLTLLPQLPSSSSETPFTNASDEDYEDDYTMEEFIRELEARQQQGPVQDVSEDRIKRFYEEPLSSWPLRSRLSKREQEEQKQNEENMNQWLQDLRQRFN